MTNLLEAIAQKIILDIQDYRSLGTCNRLRDLHYPERIIFFNPIIEPSELLVVNSVT